MPTRAGSIPSRATLIAAFATVYLVWGSTYLAIRYAIVTIPPFLMAGVRFLIAGSILYTWSRLRTTERVTAQHWRNAVVIGILLLTCGNGGVTWAEQRVPSGITALLVATVPLWMVILLWIRPGGKRPTAGVALGVVVGLIGMIELIGIGAFRGQGAIDLVGTGVLFAASLAWAGGSLFARNASLPDPIVTTGMEMLAGGTGLIALSVLTREPQRFDVHTVSTVSIVGLLYLIVFGAILGFTAYTWLIKNAKPVAVGTYAYVNPVVAVFLGWLIAHEPVTTRTVIGAAIIIAAVAIITTMQSRTKRSA